MFDTFLFYLNVFCLMLNVNSLTLGKDTTLTSIAACLNLLAIDSLYSLKGHKTDDPR